MEERKGDDDEKKSERDEGKRELEQGYDGKMVLRVPNISS